MAAPPENMIRSESEGPTPVPFQFQDVRQMAARILKRAEEQASRKLDAANAQATEIEQVAYAEGFARGEEEGREKGLAEGREAGHAEAKEAFTKRSAATAAALEEMLKALHERKTALQAQAESELLHLAYAIARLVIRREVEQNPDEIRGLVEAAIALAADRSDLIIRVHPDIAQTIDREIPALRAAFHDLERVRVGPDPALAPGDVLLVGREGEVDMRLAERVAAVERALFGGLESPADTPGEAEPAEGAAGSDPGPETASGETGPAREGPA